MPGTLGPGQAPRRRPGWQERFLRLFLGDALDRFKDRVTHWVNSAPTATRDSWDVCGKDQRLLPGAASHGNGADDWKSSRETQLCGWYHLSLV